MAKKPPAKTVPPPTADLRDIGLGVLLFAATLIAYRPALNGGFVYDDSGHVTAPPLQSLHGLWRIWFELGATQQYYPLLHSAFWVEHRLWGDAVLGYHLTNVALHVAAAFLLVAILRRLAIQGAWLAGFLFALHPVCVESVAWIAEQKNTLSAVFYLGAALAYLHFDRTRRPSRYFLAMGLFLLALLSKTVTATLPAALLVVFWWQRGRLGWKRDAGPLVPWLALGASAGLFTSWVERKYAGAEGAGFALTLAERCLIAGRAIWFYLGKLVWPRNLMLIYPRWTVNSALWWQYLFPLAVLALAAGLWLASRRRRGPLAGFLVFSGTLFPVLGFFNVFPFLFSWVADHYQYLATLGIIVPAASGLTLGVARFPPAWRRPARALTLALVATLGILTLRQSALYQDGETLFQAAVARNPDAWMAHNNLGSVLSDMPGRRAEAISHFETALRLKPDYALAHYNLAGALLETPGRMPEAIAEFEAALRCKPDYVAAHYNLGTVLLRIPGRSADAIAHLEAALRIQPDFAEAHTNLGGALLSVPGRLPEAIDHLRAALQINPALAEAHCNLGNGLLTMPGHAPEAIAEYEAALGIEPNYEAAHYGLGIALSQIPGRLGDAIAHLQAALELRPDAPEVRQALARLRAAN
jgi:tetratricopeptide (TPR) repeat protein